MCSGGCYVPMSGRVSGLHSVPKFFFLTGLEPAWGHVCPAWSLCGWQASLPGRLGACLAGLGCWPSGELPVEEPEGEAPRPVAALPEVSDPFEAIEEALSTSSSSDDDDSEVEGAPEASGGGPGGEVP